MEKAMILAVIVVAFVVLLCGGCNIMKGMLWAGAFAVPIGLVVGVIAIALGWLK